MFCLLKFWDVKVLGRSETLNCGYFHRPATWSRYLTLRSVSCAADERREEGPGVRQPPGHPDEVGGGNSG